MKRLSIPTFVVGLLFMFSGCGKSEKDISGIYVKSPSVHTVDSLFIYADQPQGNQMPNRPLYKYKQRFYNKKTGKLLFENSNTWWLEGGGDITFKGFYWDADKDHDHFVYSEEVMKDKVILFSTSMESDKILVDKQIHYAKVND